METMLRVYEAQREEIQKLTRKLRSLKSKENETAEINRLQATLEKVEKTIEFVEGIMKDTTKELRSQLRES
jgi:hypothetical protein